MTEKIKKNEKRVKPDLPGGFRDYEPAQTIAKQKILDIVRGAFENFGFDPIETSAVQKTEVLTGGDADSGKIIFNVKGSREEKEENAGTSLRFDLTIPLARFLSANQATSKPFKRYEIGRAWRGDRPQMGRYREFTQADADIVGTDSPDADLEIITLMYKILENLDIKNFLIKINNRKILDGLPDAAGFSEEKLWDALKIIDKKDKIGAEGIKLELTKEFNSDIAGKIEKFMAEISDLENAVSENAKEIKMIIGAVEDMGLDATKLVFDPYVVRGFGYYTGLIFETVLTDLPEIGSFFSGGRYDGLIATFTGQKIPAVGVSLGVDRLFAALEKLGKLSERETLTEVLVLNFPGNRTDGLCMTNELRSAGINTAFYLGEDAAFQAQLAYAVKKGISYVVIYGDDEKKKEVVSIKNLRTREQIEVAKEKLTEYFRK